MTPELPETAPARSGAEHRARGDYAAAEPLLRSAVATAERLDPFDPARLAEALNELGLLCKDLAKYDEARASYERALSLIEGTSEPNPAHVAALYHNLGGIEHARGNHVAGEPFARRGLALRRGIPNCDAREVASDMAALAALLDGQRKFDEAERLYVEALDVFEREPESNAGEIAVALNGLGALQAMRGELAPAADLLERAVTMKKRSLGARHPDVAISLTNLAVTMRWRGDGAGAAALFSEALAIFEQALGSDHPKTRSCRASAERGKEAVSRP